MKKIFHTQLFQLVLIHFREFFREPGILFWALLFPILMAWVLGAAFSSNGDTTQSFAVIKGSETANRQLQNFINKSDETQGDTVKIVKKDFENLGSVNYKIILTDWQTSESLLKKGNIQMIVSADQDSVYYHFDPVNQDARLQYVFLTSAVSDKSISEQHQVLKPITTIGSRYIDFLIPGLIAMGIMNSMIWGISYGLVEMRVKKLLRRMIATPMSRGAFMVSYFLARITISIFEASVLYLFSRYFFNINIEGSLLALFLIFLSGNIAFAGISILLSSRAGNTRIANGLINFVTLPMLFLSGIFFSYHNFPEGAERIIRFLPLTLLADGLRSVFIEGALANDIMLPITLLTGMGVLAFGVGIRIFKWY